MSLSIWAGGYSRKVTANEPAEHLEHVAKLGGAVLLATAVAAVNWAIASLIYTVEFAWWSRIAIALTMASLGAAIVLVVDRSALHFMDTKGQASRAMTFAMVTMRVTLIFIISTFTAEVAIPQVMHAELEERALQIREASDATRLNNLSSRFELPQHKAAAADDATGLQRLQAAADIIPASVEHELASSASCWRRYASRERELIAGGIDRDAARQELRGSAVVCATTQKHAQSDLAAYRSSIAAKITQTRVQQTLDLSTLARANTEITTRVNAASEIEQRAIGPASSVVLWGLVTSNPGAAIKYALFVSLMLMLETLPLLTKLLAGRSAIGARVGATRDIALLNHETRLAAHRNECRLAAGASDAMTEAMLLALRDAQTDAFMREFFLKQAQAMVPIEAAKRIMRNLEEDQHRHRCNDCSVAEIGCADGEYIRACDPGLD